MKLTMLEGMKPADFGFDPAQYPAYRTHPQTGDEVQLEVVEFAAYTEKRFAVASAPVGIGKMLIAATLMKLTGLRTAILAPYKGLEDQYTKELAEHLIDVRGRANYTCVDAGRLKLDELNCKGGLSMGCKYVMGGGCAYERARDAARIADGFVTNYDYWFNANTYAGGINRQGEDMAINEANPVELLILDECDLAPDKLAEFLATRVYEKEIMRWIDPREMGESIKQWQGFVKANDEELKQETKTTQMELMFASTHGGKVKELLGELHALERLQQKFDRILTMRDDWVLEKREGTKFGRMWAFDVVWPGRYAEQYLFCGVGKVVLMSGTVTARDMAGLGVKKEDFAYKQWSRIFPANRNPVLITPASKINAQGKVVSVGLRYGMPESDKVLWLEHIDRLIDARLDRKGLVQASSYELAKYIMTNSKHAAIMIGNTNDPESESAAQVAEIFYKMKTPAVLVSPSFARGWDFAGERAEYTIISKCPFVPREGRVMKARLLRDPKYGDSQTAKTIQQGAGRPMRSTEDRGEILLVDGQFEHFVFRNAALFQDWFVKACRRVGAGVLPSPPPKLVVKNNRK